MKKIEESPDQLRYEDENDIIEIVPASWKIVIHEKDSGDEFEHEYPTKEEAVAALKKEVEELQIENALDDKEASAEIDLKKISQDIKADLNKLYQKLNLQPGQFSSDAFNIRQESNKVIIDIPFMTTRNEMFAKKMSESSKEVVLKHLKKNGIDKKKSDLKYEGNAKGYFNASVYSVEI